MDKNKNKNVKKDIYHIHDKGYKDLYSKKEVAVDLFRTMLKAEWAKNLKPEDLELVNKSFVTSDYDESESDIVYSANINGTEVIFYILLEFQSTVDYRMPLRLLFYMCEILRYNAINAKHRKSDKNLKVPAVVPIVLYNGEEVWNVPNEFRKIIYNEELFGEGLLNFKYDVFDINHEFTKEQLIDSKNVTSAIFLLDQKIDALEFLQRIKAIALFFHGLTDVEMKAIKHWIQNTTPKPLADSAIKILESKKEDVELMVASNAFILEEMKEKAKAEGKTEGLKEGLKEGLDKGKLLGKIEDILENLRELGTVNKELEDLIIKEKNLDTLKKWLKLSYKVNSIQEFIEKMR